MGIAKQEEVRSACAIRFWIICALLFSVALALRWARLDLMTFSFDQAAICERALEMSSGKFGFTGIVNSLGFRNAPGYVWMLLPAFIISCSPIITAAWHGLICATMVVPLALTGRQFRRDAVAWLPAIMAAALPAEVFAGRNLWAQYMVTPLAAWALWALICALDKRRGFVARQRFGAAALAVLAWAMSVHYGAALLLVIAAASLWPLFRASTRREKFVLLLPAAIVGLTMLPSFADFVYRFSNPLPKPDYVLKFEAMRPPPLPWWARIAEAASASVLNSSVYAMPAVGGVLPKMGVMWVRGYDLLVGLLLGTGLLFSVAKMLRRKMEYGKREALIAAVLLAWIAVPVLTAGVLLKWVQPSYFAASLPAGWLAVLFLPQVPSGKAGAAARIGLRLLAVLLVVGGAWIVFGFLHSISVRGTVPGNYYIPFHWQAKAAEVMTQRGVAGQNVRHLSGPIFEKSYQYLVECGGGDALVKGNDRRDNYALIQDENFADGASARLQFMRQSGAAQVGPILINFFPSRGAAEISAQQYYARGATE